MLLRGAFLRPRRLAGDGERARRLCLRGAMASQGSTGFTDQQQAFMRAALEQVCALWLQRRLAPVSSARVRRVCLGAGPGRAAAAGGAHRVSLRCCWSFPLPLCVAAETRFARRCVLVRQGAVVASGSNRTNETRNVQPAAAVHARSCASKSLTPRCRGRPPGMQSWRPSTPCWQPPAAAHRLRASRSALPAPVAGLLTSATSSLLLPPGLRYWCPAMAGAATELRCTCVRVHGAGVSCT